MSGQKYIQKNVLRMRNAFFPNGAGIVEQLERDDHLGG
jgi:hypothetical protein